MNIYMYLNNACVKSDALLFCAFVLSFSPLERLHARQRCNSGVLALGELCTSPDSNLDFFLNNYFLG
jgi:hypothetical protein